MSLILQELRRAQAAAGFRDSWEWGKLETPDRGGTKLDSGNMASIENTPPGHNDVPSGDEVDGDVFGHGQDNAPVRTEGQP